MAAAVGAADGNRCAQTARRRSGAARPPRLGGARTQALRMRRGPAAPQRGQRRARVRAPAARGWMRRSVEGNEGHRGARPVQRAGGGCAPRGTPSERSARRAALAGPSAARLLPVRRLRRLRRGAAACVRRIARPPRGA
eukprot:scaffold518_cov388-Prasinococcus_capsulatus_cf.AAC.65